MLSQKDNWLKVRNEAYEKRQKNHHQINWQYAVLFIEPSTHERLLDSENDCCALVNLRCTKLSIMEPETTKLRAITGSCQSRSEDPEHWVLGIGDFECMYFQPKQGFSHWLRQFIASPRWVFSFGYNSRGNMLYSWTKNERSGSYDADRHLGRTILSGLYEKSRVQWKGKPCENDFASKFKPGDWLPSLLNLTWYKTIGGGYYLASENKLQQMKEIRIPPECGSMVMQIRWKMRTN